MPQIVLNIDNINTAAARLGLTDVIATSEPVTCELLVRLQMLLGLDLAVLAHITRETPKELPVAG
ncbi:hypothetical protein Q9R08_05295 [Microbacterium sp. QXD-8]|uniref:Uncharacterized protein n=1 Tax=Microbacterium psychrotolerans TaxID=3068321 RepID=A0ABU0YYH7_9MICO|nr:hypothetical protein [Microbacterium sp. QXD-8]MDQ7877389.1 hypothetical protein [Microbacterium sp. QXD-8]